MMGISPIAFERIIQEASTEVDPNQIAVSLSIQIVIKEIVAHTTLVQSRTLDPDLK